MSAPGELSPLGPFDAELLAALHGGIFPQAPWSAEDFSALLAFPGAAGWFALDESGSPCGFLLARKVASEAEIISFGVLPPARGQGRAKALLEALLRDAAASGVETLFLEVAEDNEAAIGLYRQAGFQAAGRRRNYYQAGGGKLDALLLSLKL
jgi:ribosomal-protein-alanine N-acetyltransferase